MEEICVNIGKQIQILRKQKGITQETLAAEMGVTVGAVSKWENGMTLPDIQMLCSLADYFDVTTDELLGRSRKGIFMVCDDASFIRTVLKDILEKEGYVCAGLAENSAQLQALFQENIPDILFLDIHLGTESGLDLLREIKEKYSSIKVICRVFENRAQNRSSAAARFSIYPKPTGKCGRFRIPCPKSGNHSR